MPAKIDLLESPINLAQTFLILVWANKTKILCVVFLHVKLLFLSGSSYSILVAVITHRMMNESCHFCSEFLHTFAIKCFSCRLGHCATKQMIFCCSAEAGGDLTTFRTEPFVIFLT